MQYTIHQLKVFLKVVEKQSVTKAAQDLHLTQPAVSIQLKNLQEQFEIPLMEVIGRKLHITSFGHEVASSAMKIVDEMQEIKNKSLAHKGLLVGQINLSVVSTAKYVMPFFLSGFMKEHPGVDLKMDVTNKARVLESLANNELDFALVSVLPENMNIEREQLMENKLYLVRKASEVSKALPKKRPFENIPLIYREKGSATRQAMEQYIEKQNIIHDKQLELTSNEAVKQAVLAGLGYSIMPLIGLKNELVTGDIEILKFKQLPITTNWNLIWLKGKQLSPVALAYLDFIREHKQQIIQEQFSWYNKY